VVFVHGFLEYEEYVDLVRNTSFIVNASRGEGQCLPLMEYMSSGVPAISPDNTAMADYVTPENAFIVKSTVEPAVWPQDPRMLFRTTRYRINWESLYLAFQESYRIARTDEQAYARMSEAAIESLRRYCSIDVAEERLRQFLTARAAGESS
jgi:glycosyltransferase involved in cell wall biosynthesis